MKCAGTVAIVIGSIVCSLAGQASAQSPHGSGGAPRSETTAFMLSLGGTLLPVGLAVGAAGSLDSPRRYSLLATSTVATAIFAPGFGHWYAGKVVTRGLGLRLAGGVTALIGLGASLSECPLGESDCTPALGIALMAIGGAVVVGGIVDDLVTAPRRARRYNREHGFAVAPIVTSDSAGLALAGRF